MQLRVPVELGAGYRSASQRARVRTEAWAAETICCLVCEAARLARRAPRKNVDDFSCEDCDA
ncbi:MAG: DpnI domain-containing protein [Thermoplasmatota archaeon]